MKLTDDERRARKRARNKASYEANREKVREQHAEYRKANPEKIRETRARYRGTHQEKARANAVTLRAAVQRAYGGACVCCGETTVEFLQVDHAYGDGGAHRKTVGASAIYRWLKKNGFPQGRFRLLCANCNLAIRFGATCPHGVTRRLDAPSGGLPPEFAPQLALVLE